MRSPAAFDAPKELWTLPELVRRQAEARGDATAVEFDLGGPVTYRDLYERSETLAAGLAGLGVSAGDGVLAMLLNRLDGLVAMLATQRLGAIWVPLNTELLGAFLEHQVRNADPVVALVDRRLVAAFEGVSTETDAALHTVVMVGEDADDGSIPDIAATRRVVDIADVVAAGGVVDVPPPRYDDIACIMYTSGTTGPAKGVLMPHAHCVLFGVGTVEATRLTSDDRYFICMPMFHANALLMQLVGTLVAGASARVVERFSPNRWLAQVRESGATVTNALGVMPEFIHGTEPTDGDRDHSLRAMMAVPVSDEWAGEFQDRFGVRIFQGYGMTECNIPFYSRPDDPLVGGMAGHLLDRWFEARVVDPETDEALPTGHAGELVIRPKEPACFMAGYFGMPEKTVESWRNLWFHTGDACFFDDEGRMHFVDRIKDCIRRRGENISSFEVEQVLNRHPDVAESVVIGVRVEGAGGEEEVKACVVPAAGARIEPVALLDYCVERMPRYAVPRFVEIIPEVPKTATGKVAKQGFRSDGVTGDTWDRESVGYIVARR